MSNINHELVYKARNGRYATDSLSNLEVQATNKARDEARALHEQYRAFLTKELGHSNFEVTNVACLADGIIGHVYAGSTLKGLGRRHCVFCGCDDFSD